ncbi:MAG: VTT domain-containing protein [Dehalococcoidales bacterium]|nr:VTT domain-containing protein [Dehalococcoidales bacterium]
MAVPDTHQEVIIPSAKAKWTRKDVFIGILTLIVTIVLSSAGIYYRHELVNISGIAGYSLVGLLVISFAAGSLLSFTAVPVPYWLLVFTLPSILAPEWGKWGILVPVVVGLTSALGATLGHLPTFMLGYGGSSLSQKVLLKFDNRFHLRAMSWAKKHGAWASFLISAIFNPMHLPMTFAMGSLRFSPPKFFLYSFLGNTVKSMFLAFAGYFGLNSLLSFLGM